MNIDDMRYVLKIAEQESITKAAQQLFITQPTLSQRLQKVEKELGMQLFERNRFGEAVPTEAGQIFCKECSHILAHYQTMEERLEALKGRKNISLGIPIRIGHDLVEGLWERLQEQRPDIQLTFVDRSNYIMEEMVAKGELDLALIRMVAPNSNYSSRILQERMPYVHLRKGSPLWEKVYYHPDDPVPYIDLRLLEGEPIVGPPNSRSRRERQWLEQIFAQVPEANLQVTHEVPSYKMYKKYAAGGIASFINSSQTLSEYACKLEPEQALPYTLYFVQNNQTDAELANVVFSLLSDVQIEL